MRSIDKADWTLRSGLSKTCDMTPLYRDLTLDYDIVLYLNYKFETNRISVPYYLIKWEFFAIK